MNFLDLVNNVLDEIDEDQLDSATFVTSTDASIRRAKRYINSVYRELFFERQDWSWVREFQTITTVDGTPAYDLSATTDTERIHAAFLSNEPPLELIPYEEYIRKYQETQTDGRGKPFLATIYNGQLKLYPTPADTYTVNVINSKKFNKLNAYDDEPYLPDGKRHVLWYGATWMASLHDREADADRWKGLYTKAVQQLRGSEGNNHKGYAIIPEEETVTSEYYESILLE